MTALEYCHDVWYKKPEWCGSGYPMVKNFDDMTTRFDRIHKRDRWMDIGRAYA